MKILCQNLNGPCPLLSLCNVLILNGVINIHPDYENISLEMITQLIANELLEKELTRNFPNEEVRASHQERLSTAISTLPSLQRGLDVNVKFNNVSSFEYTKELDCFDAFSVPLYHGWIYDPQDRETKSVIQDLSYNHLLFKLVEARGVTEKEQKGCEKDDVVTSSLSDISDTKQEDESFNNESDGGDDNHDDVDKDRRDKLLHDAKIIETFLADTASQLTYAGLLALHDTLPEGNLCTFFRNNHFSTMLKQNKSLYLLVTDLGYADKANVVWELLDEIDGNTELVDSNFRPIFLSPPSNNYPKNNDSSSATVSANRPIIDPDYLLALQLSEQSSPGAERGVQQSSACTVGYVQPPKTSNSIPPPHQSQRVHSQHGADDKGIPVTVSPTTNQPPNSHNYVVGQTHHQNRSELKLEQEERDRLTALRLEEQENASLRLQQSMSPSDLQQYREAELKYFRDKEKAQQRQQRRESQRKEESSCIVS